MILLSEETAVQTVKDYLSRGGFQALKKALGMPRQQIIDEIRKSGLRGRGGAGFPTAIKWEGVLKKDQDFHGLPAVKYLCCNMAEGEPGTFKDRYIVRKNPYQLLEGMAIASYAIGAAKAYIAIKEIFVKEIPILKKALEECTAQGYVGRDALGSGEDIVVEIALGPDSYLFGEDRALLEVLEGKPAWPRTKGIIPVLFGLYGQPTVVNNVETLCHVPHIIQKGADWFRSIGSPDTPGTTCITLSGDVNRPGIYEVPTGTSLKSVINELGGGPKGKRVKAVFSGPTNAVITEDRLDTPLDFGSMKKMGSGLGSGGFIVYDETACILKAGLNFSRFLALESCGQCPSCKSGTARITQRLERLEKGHGTAEDVLTIAEECRAIKGQGHCFLVTEESVNVSSVLHYFTEEIFQHIGNGCRLDRPLPFPKMKDFDEQRRIFYYEEEYYAHVAAQGQDFLLPLGGEDR